MYIIGVFNTNYLQNNIRYQLNNYDKIEIRRYNHETFTSKYWFWRRGQNKKKQYTCDGENISPPLSWNYESYDLKSFAVLCKDNDKHDGQFIHWIIFNIPRNNRELLTGLTDLKGLPRRTKEAKNSFGKIGYNGPCPPEGEEHRYLFRIYALDSMLDLENGVDKDQFLDTIQDHILDKGELIGVYRR
ncbi:YbhB/YbcL family Raf kinase inhibitor-like protein [Methanobacterium sp.]|uniref:YbhB/YbcL family Raf kinase inhibitor-like protein n=1 Tax=Methanobacterium sp. TaxID=2164 RepID=UPI003C78F904